MGTYRFLDLAPWGRNEDGSGEPWWRRHDEYDKGLAPCELKGRGVTGEEAAKVGVGAAGGAVVGGVITGKTKGAVIGGTVFRAETRP